MPTTLQHWARVQRPVANVGTFLVTFNTFMRMLRRVLEIHRSWWMCDPDRLSLPSPRGPRADTVLSDCGL